MTENWLDCVIADIASPVKNALVGGPFGSNLVMTDYVESGIPVIRGQNMGGRWIAGNFVFVNEAKAKQLSPNTARPGDLIFTQRGTLGQVSIVPANSYSSYIISQSQMKLTVDTEKSDPLFLYYFFKSPEQQDYINRNAIQTGVPHTNLGHLRTTPILLPPLPEQRAIAGILGALDDKIEVNRRMNATLESMARAVFRQWFVENEEVESWQVGKLGDVVKVNERSISKDYPYSEIEYIDISSVTTGHLENTTPYSLGDAPSRARRLVKHGDTIWSTVRPNRKSYLYINNPKDNLVVSTGFAVLTPKKIPPSYLYFWVTTDEFVDYLISNADGSAYPAVGAERFAEAEVLLPPKNVLDNFENIAGVMLARITHNEKESRTLASLRDSLLPKLMRGEVRVSEL